MKVFFGALLGLTRDEAGRITLRAAFLASIVAVAFVGLSAVFDPNIKYKFSKITESVKALDNKLRKFGFRVALGPPIASQGSIVTRNAVTRNAPKAGGDTVSTLERDSGTKRVHGGAVNDTVSRANSSVTNFFTDLFAALRSFGRRTVTAYRALNAEFSRGFTKYVAKSANAAEKIANAPTEILKSGNFEKRIKNTRDNNHFFWSVSLSWFKNQASALISWSEDQTSYLVSWLSERAMVFYGLLVVLLGLEIVILRIVQGALFHSNRKSQLDEWQGFRNHGADQKHALGSVGNEQKLDNTKKVSDSGLEEDSGPLSELQVTRNELEHLRAEFEQLRCTQLETQNLVGQTQAELKDSREELAQVNALADQKHAELEDLREELDRVRAELNQKHAEVGPKVDGQPQDILMMPEDAQEALTKAKEEAGRALEGWIAARNEAEYARAETEQLRHDQKAAQERSGQAQAELAASKEELALVKADADRMQAESLRMQEELARTENSAAKLREEKQDFHDRYCQSQNIIEKTRNELVQAQKNSLEIRKKEFSSQQEALKACEELIRREYDRLHSQEQGLNANLQTLEDKSQPTHGPAEAALINRCAQGQFVVDEEKLVPAIADEEESAPEQVTLPDPIVERARNELTDYSGKMANSRKTAVTAKDLNSLIQAEHDRLRSQDKVLNTDLEELVDLSQLAQPPAVAALRNDKALAECRLDDGREVITSEDHEESQPEKLGISDEPVEPIKQGGLPNSQRIANSQDITITSKNLDFLRVRIAK